MDRSKYDGNFGLFPTSKEYPRCREQRIDTTRTIIIDSGPFKPHPAQRQIPRSKDCMAGCDGNKVRPYVHYRVSVQASASVMPERLKQPQRNPMTWVCVRFPGSFLGLMRVCVVQWSVVVVVRLVDPEPALTVSAL